MARNNIKKFMKENKWMIAIVLTVIVLYLNSNYTNGNSFEIQSEEFGIIKFKQKSFLDLFAIHLDKGSYEVGSSMSISLNADVPCGTVYRVLYIFPEGSSNPYSGISLPSSELPACSSSQYILSMNAPYTPGDYNIELWYKDQNQNVIGIDGTGFLVYDSSSPSCPDDYWSDWQYLYDVPYGSYPNGYHSRNFYDYDESNTNCPITIDTQYRTFCDNGYHEVNDDCIEDSICSSPSDCGQIAGYTLDGCIGGQCEYTVIINDEDECSINNDCNDNNGCTIDTCTSTKFCDYSNACTGLANKCFSNQCVECVTSNDCISGKTCDNGVCKSSEIPPPNGITCLEPKPNNCNNICVSLKSDNNNCGSCGKKCDNGQYCDTGACIDDQSECPPEKPNKCDGACISYKTNPLNCGGCGVECVTGQTCDNGVCVGDTSFVGEETTIIQICGDGTCYAPEEDINNCESDCGVDSTTYYCGDGLCVSENSASCPQDCKQSKDYLVYFFIVGGILLFLFALNISRRS